METQERIAYCQSLLAQLRVTACVAALSLSALLQLCVSADPPSSSRSVIPPSQRSSPPSAQSSASSSNSKEKSADVAASKANSGASTLVQDATIDRHATRG